MTSIVVFGLASAGLFLLRELSKTDNDIIAIGKRKAVGRFSKYGTKYIADNSDELKKVIRLIISKHKQKPKGYIASAYYLTMILEEVPEVFDIIDIQGPGIDMYKVFDDKIKGYELLKKFDIPIPPTYSFSEIHKITSEEYPLILKWKTTEINSDNKIIRKVKVITHREEMMKLIEEIDTSETKLMVQKYLSNESIKEFRYGGYFDNGVKRLDIIVKALRQYPEGVSSLITEIKDNETTENIRTKMQLMLKAIQYTGFIQFDILINEATGDFYFLDINPRPWSSCKILKKKYKNFYQLFNNDYNAIIKRPEIVRWVNISTDFLSIIRRAKKRKSIISVFKDYREYFRKNLITDIVQLNDLGPIIGLAKLAIIKLKNVLTGK